MGSIKTVDPVKLFIGVTTNGSGDLARIEPTLVNNWGEIEYRSDLFDFSAHTGYYEREMGAGLRKQWLVFKNLVEATTLPDIKLRTNEIELEFSRKPDCRDINLDPGYITAANLILATTKNFSHRIYLGKGIFGDLHLIFQEKTFNRMPWTYPDYYREAGIRFFNDIRENYMNQLRKNKEL